MRKRGIPQQPSIPPMPPTPKQRRIRDIHDSITVAMAKGVIIPREWIDEYNTIITQ